MEAQPDTTGQLLDSLGDLLTTLLEGPSGDADECGHSLIDEHLKGFFHGFYQLRSREEAQTLTVAVLALTKSGVQLSEAAWWGLKACMISRGLVGPEHGLAGAKPIVVALAFT